MADYLDYNAEDGEDDHIHVEVRGRDGEWVHLSRIAEHGLAKIIRDKGWRHHQLGWVSTARFIKDWGSGEVVVLTDGEVVP